MRSGKFIQSCLATAALVVVAGCASNVSKTMTSSSHVKSFNGSYKAPSSVSVQNDIKGILVAGGLSTNNPSAPTRSTRVAEISNTSSPSAAVTQLVAKLEGGSPSKIGITSPSRVGRPQVAPTEEPTTLIASIQQNRINSKPAPQGKRTRPNPAAQPTTPAFDPVMVALNSVVPTPTSAPQPTSVANSNDRFDVTPVARSVPPIAETYVAEVDQVTTRYPDIGAAVAFAEPEPAPRKVRVAPKRARVSHSPAVQAPEMPVQQASVQFSKPRRF